MLINSSPGLYSSFTLFLFCSLLKIQLNPINEVFSDSHLFITCLVSLVSVWLPSVTSCPMSTCLCALPFLADPWVGWYVQNCFRQFVVIGTCSLLCLLLNWVGWGAIFLFWYMEYSGNFFATLRNFKLGALDYRSEPLSSAENDFSLVTFISPFQTIYISRRDWSSSAYWKIWAVLLSSCLALKHFTNFLVMTDFLKLCCSL